MGTELRADSAAAATELAVRRACLLAAISFTHVHARLPFTTRKHVQTAGSQARRVSGGRSETSLGGTESLGSRVRAQGRAG